MRHQHIAAFEQGAGVAQFDALGFAVGTRKHRSGRRRHKRG
jgi:hypothetical protein